MNKRAAQILFSYATAIVLLLVFAAGLAVATFIEKHYGTPAARTMVYYSPVFFLLQLLLVAHFVAVVIRHRLLVQRKWSMLAVHAALMVILLGALVSHLTGQEGYLHLREGEQSNRMAIQTEQGVTYRAIPFTVELVRFTLTRYPGSHSPSSYESELLVHVDGQIRRERVYMNNVLDVKGYRFFQASYDEDERGTVLSVNRDVAGRNITYAGYLLLTIGFVFSIFGRNSRFRSLNRTLNRLKKGSLVAVWMALFLVVPFAGQANRDGQAAMELVQQHVVPAGHAARLGALPIQAANGRMVPVNTFSSEILRKLHKSHRLGALNSDQFLLSLLAMPDVWLQVPFISLPNDEVAAYYNLSPGQCAYMELFSADGQYKLQQRLEEAYHKAPAVRTRFDKDLLKLDEQVNIVHQLINLQSIKLFPLEDDPTHTWYAPGNDLAAFAPQDSMFVTRILGWYAMELQEGLKSGRWEQADKVLDMIRTYQQAKNTTLSIDIERMQTEIKYNGMDPFRQCKKGYLMLGGALLVLAFIEIFRPAKWLRALAWVLAAGVLVVFHYHMAGMGMRWYIAGHAPWSNSYETMVYVAWAVVFAGLLFMRKSTLAFALATLLAGIILFVSGLNWMDPEINPLVPVLKSPWLMFHVAVIVAAYGFFGIGWLAGTANLVMMITAGQKNDPLGKNNNNQLWLRIRELTCINEMALLIGLALMTVGTFLGAVWANESWGRYWGWDPKETWALITVVVYAIVLHLRLVKKWNNLWLFNSASVVAFASVLMTYFGVNYFLSGMHSYGQTGGMNGLSGYLWAAVAAVALLIGAAGYKYKGMRRTKSGSPTPFLDPADELK